MKKYFIHITLVLTGITLMVIGTNAVGIVKKTHEEFDSGNFNNDSVKVSNKWFPLIPGTRMTWAGSTRNDAGKIEKHKVQWVVTDLIKEIDGVKTVVCWDRDYADGVLQEAEIIFFAQDKHGTVWHFGQYPEEYRNGKVVATPGWLHGSQDGNAGIYMPANPKKGDKSFSQGWAPSVPWTDRAVIDQTGLTVKVPLGIYKNVITFKENSLEEKDGFQVKYYASGVGYIKVGFLGEDKKQEILELVKIEKLDKKELQAARQEAMRLEKNAYKNVKSAFAKTKPSTVRKN